MESNFICAFYSFKQIVGQTMSQNINKNFLDFLLNSMQQNLSSTSFAFDLARSAGLTFKTNGNFESGMQLTGTNQDDTIIIGGDVLGGITEVTSIDFLDGNDTVTIGGSIIAQSGQSINFTSGDGDKIVNIHGAVEANNSHIDIDFEPKLLSNFTIQIDGGINSSNNAELTSALSGTQCSITINNGIYVKDNSSLNSENLAYNNVTNIHGDIVADNNSKIYFCDESGWRYDYPQTINMTIDGSLTANNASEISIMQNADNVNLSCKGVNVSNNSMVELNLWSPIGSTTEVLIDGNITVTDESKFNLFLNAYSNIEIYGSFTLENSTVDLRTDEGNMTIIGGISNTNGSFDLSTYHNKNLYIEGDIVANCDERSNNKQVINDISLNSDNDTFTLVGNLSANNNSLNKITSGYDNTNITIVGNVSATNNGINTISTNIGDDIINLNGHIGAGTLTIDTGRGNDTLILTAATQRLFETDYKEWLTDLSASGSLAKSSIETIRVDVNFLQPNKLGWLTDIVNKANADGAHIAVEDKAGHQLVNPSTYLAQGNDTHNPINDVLDQYAPAAANAAQPKTFAETVTGSSTDAFTAPHLDNSNFLHEMEQQAQAQAAAAA